MTDIALRVENLSKLYRIGGPQERYKTLRDTVMDVAAAPIQRLRRLRQPTPPAETIWALKDVSFEVKHGEVLGIIGRNGAGKTTLLRILSRITEPTEGRAEISGRVGSLLEVGTGFHPELTGRENIYLNGAILGMKRAQINKRFDEIVAFSEIEKFLDTPVKRYSSGMRVRLAFAVAAHLEPEILLVDEVLAVGDSAFQKKCLGKMKEVTTGEGRTILFVSHNMSAVRQLCARAIWLETGAIAADEDAVDAIDRYLASQRIDTGGQADVGSLDREGHYGQQVRIQTCTLYNAAGEVSSLLRYGEPFSVELSGYSHRNFEQVGAIVGIDTPESIRVVTSTSEDSGLVYNLRPGQQFRIRADFQNLPLNVGDYAVTIALRTGRVVLDRVPTCLRFELLDSPYEGTRLIHSKAYGLLRFAAKWRPDAAAPAKESS
jgi:lipopolysaccharide transport system ATP-binding protein